MNTDTFMIQTVASTTLITKNLNSSFVQILRPIYQFNVIVYSRTDHTTNLITTVKLENFTCG